MWVWMRNRHPDRASEKRWQTLKIAGLYAVGALLLVFGIAMLSGH